MAIPDIEELLAPAFCEGLEEMAIEEVRSRRDRCQEAADALSYLRRLAQGRLDLVHAELDRRASGEEGTLEDLVEQLKRGEILSGGVRAGGLGRPPTDAVPADADGWITRELEAVAGAGRLGQLTDLGEPDVRDIAGALEALERRVSDQRAQLHERTNALQEEIIRRYKTGEATVETLLK